MTGKSNLTPLALRHASLVVIAILMLIPFYWVLKTAITNENIYAYPPGLLPKDPHLYNFVDVTEQHVLRAAATGLADDQHAAQSNLPFERAFDTDTARAVDGAMPDDA